PDGDHRFDASRQRGGRRDEVDVPHETDARGERQLVVDHLVERPAIARPVRIAVSPRDMEDSLLLAGEEERPALAVDPYAMVQMDDVHRRPRAVEVLQVRLHAHDVAVNRRLLVLSDRHHLHRVLPREDLDWCRPEMEMLDAGLVRPRPRLRRAPRTGRSTRGCGNNNRDADRNDQRDREAGHTWHPANPPSW